MRDPKYILDPSPAALVNVALLHRSCEKKEAIKMFGGVKQFHGSMVLFPTELARYFSAMSLLNGVGPIR